jgi:dienelactone hydrolase
MTLPASGFPDPFLFSDGTRIATVADWPRRRREILELISSIEYGQIPPAPMGVDCEELHRHQVARYEKAIHRCLRLTALGEKPFSFLVDLYVPQGAGPFPVVVNGDACWRYLTDEIITDVIRRGYALASFNRLEFAPDNGNAARTTGIYPLFPGIDFGALAAWAWGYHRVVDHLVARPEINAKQIAITGHSRGGKCVLLAGATDERIALTNPNNSGCGGAGSFKWQAEKCETLADILKAFPYWFSPRLKEFIEKERELPFDQHFVKALIAPRALLSTEALGDLWANPEGTLQTHLAAREVWRFLGAENEIAVRYREGEHAHKTVDWLVLLDFADWRLRGIAPPPGFGVHPFGELPRPWSWEAPIR